MVLENGSVEFVEEPGFENFKISSMPILITLV
jgi:hypothetical protein